MSDTPDRDEDDRTLAGELALGVLEGEERRAAEARMATDAHFAALVAEWQDRFGDLAAEAAPVAPPARAWDRLERELFAPSRPAAPSGLWNSLRFWRWFAAGTTALAAACFAFVVAVTLPQGEPPLVAALQSAANGPVFLAHVDAASGAVVVHVLQPERDPLRVPELWVIPADGVPRSLGLIKRQGETALALAPALRPFAEAGVTLAVSLEPAGGSPTGKPTGPVIATGRLSKI